jgi:hypothetical protein
LFLLFGLFGVVLGMAGAVSATWFPAYKSRLERWGGALFIVGLAVTGFALPMI